MPKRSVKRRGRGRTTMEGMTTAKQRTARRKARKASPVRVLRAEDLPDDSALRR